MGIRRGTATPTKIYRGTTPVKKVMRGAVEVWRDTMYPYSGTFTVTSASLAFVTAHTFTVTEPGNLTITVSVNYPGGFSNQCRIATPSGNTTGNRVSAGTSTATRTDTLAVGDTIQFQSVTGSTQGVPAPATYTITKN